MKRDRRTAMDGLMHKAFEGHDWRDTKIERARNFVDWSGHIDQDVMAADRRTRLHGAIDKMIARHSSNPDVQRVLRLHQSLDRVLADHEEQEEYGVSARDIARRQHDEDEPEASASTSASASAEPGEEGADALEALGLDRHDRSSANLLRAIDRAQHRHRGRMSTAMDSAYTIPYEIRYPDGRRETVMCRPVRWSERAKHYV